MRRDSNASRSLRPRSPRWDVSARTASRASSEKAPVYEVLATDAQAIAVQPMPTIPAFFCLPTTLAVGTMPTMRLCRRQTFPPSLTSKVMKMPLDGVTAVSERLQQRSLSSATLSSHARCTSRDRTAINL